ncbi:Nitronate monooxygenase [Bacillus sp. UNCCL13]|nr:Nitronate monooxygenase [Bacillus sp. UNCCL13]
MGTATTVDEAQQLENSGVDMIVAQGSEAGGHRGTFPTTKGNPQIGLIALVQQMVHSVKTPVIAAGGIVTIGGIKAVLSLGAAGAQLGTVFLTCKESGTNRAYRNKIIESNEEDVIMTKAFSGKWARGIRNKFIEVIEKASLDIPPYPIQNDLTKLMRSHAARELNPEKLSLWAGQGVGLIQREYSAAEILAELVSELNIG